MYKASFSIRLNSNKTSFMSFISRQRYGRTRQGSGFPHLKRDSCDVSQEHKGIQMDDGLNCRAPKEESTGLKRVGQSLHLLAQLEGEQADNPPAKIAKVSKKSLKIENFLKYSQAFCKYILAHQIKKALFWCATFVHIYLDLKNYSYLILSSSATSFDHIGSA